MVGGPDQAERIAATDSEAFVTHTRIAILLAATLIGCAPATQEQPDSTPGPGGRVTAAVPAASPSITGTVTAIGEGGTLRIEVNPKEESGSAKAQVRVREGVAIFERSGISRRFEDIRQGQTVSAWFTGPVAESYPVQATASVIVIERSVAIDSTAHASGFGPVRTGMTVAEAEHALGAPLVLLGPRMEPCHYLAVDGQPGVAFMIIDGRIARVDVRRHATVQTAEGAGIGDTEARIHALYPGRVEVQPHKYAEGHYLIVTPAAPADSAYRLIFETDGKRVTTFRTGRLPEVGWVEGCS